MRQPELSAIFAVAIVTAAVTALCVRAMRRRAMHRWLLPYLRETRRRRPRHRGEEVRVLLCIADHFEPQNGGVPLDVARGRVDRWVSQYPLLFDRFQDSGARPPRHTFFYPLEMYDADEVDALAELCRRGFGEIEVHLHHDNDHADALRERLLAYTAMLSDRHGLLPRHRESAALGYGFIHGNWALDNSRPDGRHCGVNKELDVLLQTGCYADFTLPSAPNPTQTRQINSIYYGRDDARPKSHDRGIRVGLARPPADALMLIQGPLLLDWNRRKWGMLPHVENACLQSSQPPTIDRLRLWLRARVQIPTRPDWFFVKLHTHGAPEANQKVLLGEPMVKFHQELARLASEDPSFHYHYVTAREMYNLAKAAEAGWKGSIDAARDWEFVWPQTRQSTTTPAHPPRTLSLRP